ncbi:glycosyltransferase [Myxacorys almedinensis]|nr:glycosyltransferase family 2 protein [Myxacorys almedinensis]
MSLVPHSGSDRSLEELSKTSLPKISVIIPAYNEACTIEACVTSVLESTDLSVEQLEVLVIDDQSTDETAAIVELLQASRQDNRLHLITGQPRPTDHHWMGKNWACTQAVQQATGDYFLFLDADVQLQPGCLETTVAFAQKEQVDLLTFWLTILCGCFAEWLAQPIIANLLAAGYAFDQVNDPHSETVFAVGPFMLFRRSAYEQIGGHRAVADYVLEDVELGRRIKQHQLKLWYGIGHDLAQVRMYQSFSALWEGWTKNWHLGSKRNGRRTLYTALITILVFTVPWLGLLIAVIEGVTNSFTGWTIAAIALSLIGIRLHYSIRQLTQHLTNIPLRSWWLTGLGGLLVSAIAIASIIKVETGWGWTWRGRSLVNPASIR